MRVALTRTFVKLLVLAVFSALILPIELDMRKGSLGLIKANAQSCSVGVLTRNMKLDRKLNKSEERKLVTWCQNAQKLDQQVAKNGSAALAATNTGNSAIVCTANNCVCWQGNHWNGCNDITICSTELTCTWHLCTCTPN